MSALIAKANAGVQTLVGLRLEFGSRPDTPVDRFRVTERELDVLQILGEHRYLTSTLIAALAWGDYTPHFRRRLKLLHDAGLVRRFRQAATLGTGQVEWVYELDAPGYRFLTDHRPDACPRWARSHLASFSYAEHDLELNALITTIASRAAALENRGGPLLHDAPFAWHGDRSGLIDPAAEQRPLDADPASELAPGHVIVDATSVRGQLAPDATLTGTLRSTGEPAAVLIEYDRTRRASKLIAKLARYDHFLADGWRRTRFARLPHEPAVLFVTRDDDQLPAVLAEADRQLTAWVGPSGTHPTGGRFPGREEIGFTSRQRLLDGDLRLLQTPSVPGPASGRPPPHETSLSLERLFMPVDQR